MSNHTPGTCQAELAANNLIPRKYYGQVFTTDDAVIGKLVETVKSLYKPGMKIVEIGGGLGYITEALAKEFDDIDCVELDEGLFKILENKFCHSDRSGGMNKKFVQQKSVHVIHGDILTYSIPPTNYLLVGNIPFHVSGKLYRRFMSDEMHKPAGMVFITDKQYATTLMGQPPRCYRVSLQAQAYGDIEIIADVPLTSVYPAPKVMSCIVKITHRPTPLPENFWKTVNYHYENFPTKEVESPKTLGLKDWIELAKESNLQENEGPF